LTISPCHDDVKNAAGKTSVNWQVMWQAGEIKIFMPSHKEFSIDIEAGKPARCNTGYVGKVVDLQPGHPAPPTSMDSVHMDPAVHWCLCKDAPGASTQVPGEQYVTLDIADGQVIRALAVCPFLPHK
jgi:hypothetical protein